MNRKFKIYKVTNQVSGKSYIGQTIRMFSKRKARHLADAKAGSKYCFHKAIRKYGPEAFEWDILCICLSKKEADAKEKVFINFFFTKAPTGYNLTDGGGGSFGLIPWNKGKPPTAENREKMSAAQRNRTEETKAKMSEANKGQVPWNKGGKCTAEQRSKISAANKGRKLSAETKAKMSKAGKRRKHTAEGRMG